MKFHKATLKDSQLIAEMNYQMIKDQKHRNSMNVTQLNRRMKKWLAGDYGAYLFLNEGKTIGYCLFHKTKEFMYVRQFYIEKTSRRRGLGLMALNWLRKNVWKKENRFRLDVLVGNERAIRFWEAAGFTKYCLTMELEK